MNQVVKHVPIRIGNRNHCRCCVCDNNIVVLRVRESLLDPPQGLHCGVIFFRRIILQNNDVPLGVGWGGRANNQGIESRMCAGWGKEINILACRRHCGSASKLNHFEFSRRRSRLGRRKRHDNITDGSTQMDDLCLERFLAGRLILGTIRKRRVDLPTADSSQPGSLPPDSLRYELVHSILENVARR